jgi:hypothetical protein
VGNNGCQILNQNFQIDDEKINNLGLIKKINQHQMNQEEILDLLDKEKLMGLKLDEITSRPRFYEMNFSFLKLS